MKKITRKKLAVSVMVTIFLVFLIAGFGIAVRCKGFGSSEAAGWAQAIGSFGAIVGAVYIMNSQFRDATYRAKEARSAELGNLLKAVGSEISAFEKMLSVIQSDMTNNPSMVFSGRYQMVYPEILASFPIYEACALEIGKIENDVFRNEIVETYAEIRAFLAALNKNSTFAERVPMNEAPSGDVAVALAHLGPKLQRQLESLSVQLARLKVTIASTRDS